MKYIQDLIPEEELPVRPGLKVVRKNDPDYGLSESEIQDRNEFIRCYLLKDFEVLLLIPKPIAENEFFLFDFNPQEDGYSALNTHDFQRRLRPFDRYDYAMKKIMERVKNLAIMHSCISQSENRIKVVEKFESFMDFQFRSRMKELADEYHNEANGEKRSLIKQKIAKLARKLFDCKVVWERFAPTEKWDN